MDERDRRIAELLEADLSASHRLGVGHVARGVTAHGGDLVIVDAGSWGCGLSVGLRLHGLIDSARVGMVGFEKRLASAF